MAFEVAHQLECAGIDVEAVFLFDTRLRAPMPWRRFKLWSRKHARNTLEQGLGYLGSTTWTKLDMGSAKIESQPGRRCRLYPKLPCLSTKLVFRRGPTMRGSWGTRIKIYRPRRLRSRGVLFLSSAGKEKFYDEFDGTVGTGQLFRGGLKILEVPGDHSSMFQEPHIRTMAQQLDGYLEQLHPD